MSYIVYKVNGALNPACPEYMVRLKAFGTSAEAHNYALHYSLKEQCHCSVMWVKSI